MRISDWSSDVCSSDLLILRSRRGVSRAGVSKDDAARVLPRHRALADRQALGGTPRGRTPGARPVAAVRPAGDRRPRAGGARRAAGGGRALPLSDAARLPAGPLVAA